MAEKMTLNERIAVWCEGYIWMADEQGKRHLRRDQQSSPYRWTVSVGAEPVGKGWSQTPDYEHDDAACLRALNTWKDAGEYRSIAIVWGNEKQWEVRLYDAAIALITPQRCGRATGITFAAAASAALGELTKTN